MVLFLWVCLCRSIDSFKLTCLHLYSCQLFCSSLALVWCCLNRSAACQLGRFGAWVVLPSGRQWDCSTDSFDARAQALWEVQLCSETLQTLSKFSWVRMACEGNGSNDDILCSMNRYTGAVSLPAGVLGHAWNCPFAVLIWLTLTFVQHLELKLRPSLLEAVL